LPPLAEHKKMVERLDALQAKAHAVKALQAETSAELAAMLPAILDKAFKGALSLSYVYLTMLRWRLQRSLRRSRPGAATSAIAIWPSPCKASEAGQGARSEVRDFRYQPAR
jgi:hypothetical protein